MTVPLLTKPVPHARSSGFYDWRHIGGQHWQHAAEDYVSPMGYEAEAAAPGTVLFAGWAGAVAGGMVAIDIGSGFQIRYLHLQAFYVHVGQRVVRGLKIGQTNNSGASTGAHLHFAVWADTLAQALQVQSDPVLTFEKWAVDPSKMYVALTKPTPSPEEEDMAGYIILQATDTGIYYTYDPVTDSAVELSSVGFKAMQAAEKEGTIKMTGVPVTSNDVAGINK